MDNEEGIFPAIIIMQDYQKLRNLKAKFFTSEQH